MAILINENKPFNLKYEPRDEQIKMKDFVIDSIQKGKKNILIDAPVGCLTKNEKITIYIMKD